MIWIGDDLEEKKKEEEKKEEKKKEEKKEEEEKHYLPKTFSSIGVGSPFYISIRACAIFQNKSP